MPILLSLAALPLLFTLFWQAKDRPDRPPRAWDEAFLLAVTFWAAIAVSLAESLSPFEALALGPLAAAWAAVDAALLAWAWIAWRRRRTRVSFRGREFTRLDLLLLGILGVYLVVLGAVAWTAPSNNPDSLLYHMARVVHWAQQGSLAHYGTGYGQQLWTPPGAEILILNFRILTGSDRLANLVQWFAYAGSLVAVWWLGKGFGLKRRARWVAVAFAASIPMAVLQSTSTKNDMVVGFWLIVFGGFVLVASRRHVTLLDQSALGLALGLGLLTKATFYLFCAPFVIWLVASRHWRVNIRRSLGELLVVMALSAALNLPHAVRNFDMGWTPIGPTEALPMQRTIGPAAVTLAASGLRTLQAGLLHFATPWPTVNERVAEAVAGLQRALGVESGGLVLTWGWNHENFAGSPVHFLFLLATGACLILQRNWRRESLCYAGCLVAGFALLAATTANAVEQINLRYQLPIIVAWSPLVGEVLARNVTPRTLAKIAFVFSLAPIPWLLFNNTRPVIGLQPEPGTLEMGCNDTLGCTAIGSVFAVGATDVLFASIRSSEASYVSVAAVLASSTCRRVGLKIDSSDPEYALWYLLKAPQSGFHLESIYTYPDLEPLLDRSFRPCAIICTICGGRTRLHGLNLASQFNGTKLFVGDGFTWDEDG